MNALTRSIIASIVMYSVFAVILVVVVVGVIGNLQRPQFIVYADTETKQSGVFVIRAFGEIVYCVPNDCTILRPHYPYAPGRQKTSG
jgi:hypothetical protein